MATAEALKSFSCFMVQLLVSGRGTPPAFSKKYAPCGLWLQQSPFLGGLRARDAAAVHVQGRQIVDAPQPVAAAEGGEVVAEPHIRRQGLVDVLGIAAAQHHVVGEKR